MRSVGGAACATCPTESELIAFVAGALQGGEHGLVERHTAQCSHCRLLLTAACDALASGPQRVRRLHPGEVLSERYRVIRRLGAGGMGSVYEAEDALLGEHIALKTLHAELADDPRAAETLKSEARLARRISHPHVCRVYDFGSDGELQYLSMELRAGPCLRSLLPGRPLPAQRTLSISLQLLAALSAAHRAGVLHRDFKPDNVMLRNAASDAEWQAVVTDFGLARAFPAGQRQVTASRMLVGSAPYLAPEQIEAAPLTEATDLYSFGVVLFELLTGRLPFLADTTLGTAMQRLTRPAPRPSAIHPDVDPRFDEFVLRCLARDPSQRFASAELCRAELQRLARTAAAARPAPLATRLPASGVIRAAAAGVCLGLVLVNPGTATGPRTPRGDSAALALREPPGLARAIQDEAWTHGAASAAAPAAAELGTLQPSAAAGAQRTTQRASVEAAAGAERPAPQPTAAAVAQRTTQRASVPKVQRAREFKANANASDRVETATAEALPALTAVPGRATLRPDGFIDPFGR